MALAWGVILLILNVRLETWLASFHGISLAEMHRLLPGWVIPLLTLTVVGWVGLLLKMTQPDRLLPGSPVQGSNPAGPGDW